MLGEILRFYNGPEKTFAPVGFPQGINQIQNACAFCHSTPDWLNSVLPFRILKENIGNAEHLPQMGYPSLGILSARPLRVEIIRFFPDKRLPSARSVRYLEHPNHLPFL